MAATYYIATSPRKPAHLPTYCDHCSVKVEDERAVDIGSGLGDSSLLRYVEDGPMKIKHLEFLSFIS